MEKEFIPYEEALSLKELGFDEPCFGYYHDKRLTGVNKWDRKDFEFHILSKKEVTSTTVEIVIAPLYQQAFRWFREKYILIGFIEHEIIDDSESAYTWTIKEYIDEGVEGTRKKDEWDFWKRRDSFNDYQMWWKTYEEAELECLKKLIKIVKENVVLS